MTPKKNCESESHRDLVGDRGPRARRFQLAPAGQGRARDRERSHDPPLPVGMGPGQPVDHLDRLVLALPPVVQVLHVVRGERIPGPAVPVLVHVLGNAVAQLQVAEEVLEGRQVAPLGSRLNPVGGEVRKSRKKPLAQSKKLNIARTVVAGRVPAGTRTLSLALDVDQRAALHGTGLRSLASPIVLLGALLVRRRSGGASPRSRSLLDLELDRRTGRGSPSRRSARPGR